MKKLSVLLCFVFTVSCATTPTKVAPRAAPQTVKSAFQALESKARASKAPADLLKLKAFAVQHADTDIADDAFMVLGKTYCAKKDYQNCYSSYLQVIDSEFISPNEVDAVIGASHALLKLDRNDEVLSLTQRGIRTENLRKETLIELYSIRLDALAKTGDRVEALRALSFLSDHADQESLRDRSRLRASELVRSIDDVEVLKRIAGDSSFGTVRADVLYKVGVLEFEQRNYSSAERYLKSAVELKPEAETTQRAEKILEQIAARNRVDPMVIGAVLPLSGKYSAIGYKTLRGLELGLGITGRSSSSFKLAVVDSVGNPDIARQGVERLVIEDSAIAVVGDISSRSADLVAEKSDELGLPNISLAQKSGVPAQSPFVFRNALTSEALVRELVRSAMEDQGMKRFAILYPNDPYGVEYSNIFWEEVKARGGEIVGAQAYQTGQREFGDAIKRLIGTFYIEPREQELTYLLKDWYSKQKVVNARTKAPDDLLAPIIDFDAIFVPDSVTNLAQVASMLIYNDVDNVRLLGTNLWNTPDLTRRGTKLVNNSIFVDAASSLDNRMKSSGFYRDFVATYGHEPSVFEAQAYDTGLALRQAIASGARSRSALRDALLQLRSFPGAVGEITVQANQEFSRPLVALTVVEEQIVPIVKAPNTVRE